jgi:hypothetical protein
MSPTAVAQGIGGNWMKLLRVFALVALCLAYAPTPAAAVTGYDSAYAGESAFVTINPGETQSFQVFFVNGGSVTWTKGSDTQVDLAACLEDKVTCNAQDPTDSLWNSGWLSPSRYATTTQVTVAPFATATFAYNIKAPANATGTHRFNGDLVVAKTGQRIHPQGYYQDATVNAIGSTGPTPSPTPGSTPFPSAPPVIAPTPLNFTVSPWAYACGTTTRGNPVTATDTPDSNGCPANDTGGAATASYQERALSLSKGGVTSDDMSSGATIGGISSLTSASFDVAGYCGAGAPRLNVTTSDGKTHFFGCSANRVAESNHVVLNLSASGDGSGNGGVSPGDTVTAIDFVFDETGASTLTNIKFNGMAQ